MLDPNLNQERDETRKKKQHDFTGEKKKVNVSKPAAGIQIN